MKMQYWRILVAYLENKGARVDKIFTLVTHCFERVNAFTLEKIAETINKDKVLVEVSVFKVCDIDQVDPPQSIPSGS